MSNQGFVKSLNLAPEEISDARAIWNNLYGEGSVAEDIELFQPVKELVWNTLQDQIVDNKFQFASASPVYQNGDQVQVFGSWTNDQLIAGNTYEVTGVTLVAGEWRLGLKDVTLNPANVSVVQFTRQISQANLLAIVEPQNTNQDNVGRVYPNITNLRQSLDDLSESAGRLGSELQQKLLPDQSVNLDSSIYVEGAVVIQDPAGFNTTVDKLVGPTGPGIFVSDPKSDLFDIQTLRKDSVTGNPWTGPTGSYNSLQTVARSANVAQLEINHNAFQIDGLIMQGVPVRSCVDTGDQVAGMIDREGRLWTWGQNTPGQLGRGPDASGFGEVIANSDSSLRFTQISVGASHMLALDTQGRVWVWGRNLEGQLGIANLTNQNLPVRIVSLTGVTRIHANQNSSMCLVNNTLYVWGDNQFGQLGLGDTQNRNIPQVVSGTYMWAQVGDHSLAINTLGQLFATGRNNQGQLGVNDTVNRSSFTPVMQGANSSPWSSVSVGANHSVGINTVGVMFAWGANNRGQLGVSGIVSSPVPVATGGSQTWKQVSAGSEYSLAQNINYAVYATGLNGSGQLGINNRFNRSSWTQMGLTGNGLGRKTWAQVVAGANLSMGINHKGELLAWGNASSFGQSEQQTQPVILLQQTTAVTESVTDSLTISVNSTLGIQINSLCKSSLVPANTRVTNISGSQITLSVPVTVFTGQVLTFVYDRWDSDQPVLFDRKTPVVVNNQTYYLLLRG